MLLVESRRVYDHFLVQIAVRTIDHDGGKLLLVRHVVLGGPLAHGGWSGMLPVVAALLGLNCWSGVLRAVAALLALSGWSGILVVHVAVPSCPESQLSTITQRRSATADLSSLGKHHWQVYQLCEHWTDESSPAWQVDSPLS